MPNRIIRESIWSSPNLNELSHDAEMHFYRTLLASDDWGCFECTPLVLKGKCYPRREHITEKLVETWTNELISKNILRIWKDGDRLYAQFYNFDKHNPEIERHDPKTPCPPWLSENNRGVDPRISDKTERAFKRIQDAILKLKNNGAMPTQIEIAQEAHSSKSTVVKYFKHYTLSTLGTDGKTGGTDGE